jgi:uncharacterized protein YunC (DUF1805 family)
MSSSSDFQEPEDIKSLYAASIVSEMIKIDKISAGGGTFQGLKVELKNLPPLLLIEGEKGFVMCGYLNIDAAESLGATAAVVAGVNSFEDVLDAEIKTSTTKAKALGLEPGKIVRDVIEALA